MNSIKMQVSRFQYQVASIKIGHGHEPKEDFEKDFAHSYTDSILFS